MFGVTVIIPVYNNGEYVENAIESVLSQQGVPVEVIVVDDGSTDRTPAVLERLAAHCRIFRQNRAGACVARNIGIEHASMPMIKFLDADDYLCEGALAAQVHQLLATERMDVSVFGDVQWVDCDANCLSMSQPPSSDEFAFANMNFFSPLTSAPLHWTDNVRRVGGFDPRIPRAQEFDLHMRMWLSDVRFAYRAMTVYCYRQHNGGRISDRDGDVDVLKARLAAFNRYLLLAEQKHTRELPKELLQLFGRLIWATGRQAIRCGGDVSIASNYFRLASNMRIAGVVNGSAPYRFLAQVGGPVLAERLLARLKACVRK